MSKRTAAECEIQNAKQWVDSAVSSFVAGNRHEARACMTRSFVNARAALKLIGKSRAKWAVDVEIKAQDFLSWEGVDGVDIAALRDLAA